MRVPPARCADRGGAPKTAGRQALVVALVALFGLSCWPSYGGEAAPSGDPRYVPIKGCAWRLALGDIKGDGKNELIYGAYDGALRCVEPATGNLLWDAPLGGFPFAVAVCDVNDDGKAESFAACSDGAVYAVGPNGKPLWKQQTDVPVWCLAVGRLRKDGRPLLAFAGLDHKVRVVNAETGALLAESTEVAAHADCMAAADVDGDGVDEIVIVGIEGYWSNDGFTAFKLEEGGLRRLWAFATTVPQGTTSGEHYGGHPGPGEFGFLSSSMDAGDLDGDGRAEIVGGDSFYNNKAIAAFSAAGKRLWLTKSVDQERLEQIWSGERFVDRFSMAIVRIAEVVAESSGPEVVSVTGSVLRIHGTRGELLSLAQAPIGFTDLALDGKTLYLGSGPNGDQTIYRIELSGDWRTAFGSLRPVGVPGAVSVNIARLKNQIRACRGSAPRRLEPYELFMWNHSSQVPKWVESVGADKSLFVGSSIVFSIENRGDTDENGKHFGWGDLSAGKPAAELVEIARRAEAEKNRMSFTIGGQSVPSMRLQTVEEILKAAPSVAVSFQTVEDEVLANMSRYFGWWLPKAADLCAKHGRCKIVNRPKNVWWFAFPPRKAIFDGLTGGERGKVFVMATEDSFSRTTELNLLARFGLRQAGLISSMEANCIEDMSCLNYWAHQWAYPRAGSMWLRWLVACTLLGADRYAWCLGTDTIRSAEGLEPFVLMLSKGLVFPPQPEQIASVCPVGLAVHEPPTKWIEEGINGWTPQMWIDKGWRQDAEMREAFVPQSGVTWSLAPVPEHAFQRVALNKRINFGWHIPATPYGAIAVVPAHADLTKVPGVREWWHTDGLHLWREGREKLNGMRAADAFRASLENARASLPFVYEGDDCFFQTVKMTEGVYRVYAVEPGWIEPRDRRLQVKIQVPGTFAVKDLLSGERLAVSQQGFALDVPAGALRIVEAAAE